MRIFDNDIKLRDFGFQKRQPLFPIRKAAVSFNTEEPYPDSNAAVLLCILIVFFNGSLLSKIVLFHQNLNRFLF